jgi:D-arabinono-1,4-lactone oxidase
VRAPSRWSTAATPPFAPRWTLDAQDFQDTYGARAGACHRDDALLGCARVSLGEWGLLYAVVINVHAAPQQKLQEDRVVLPWGLMKPQLELQVNGSDHCEFWVCPYPDPGIGGDHLAVLVKRNRVDGATVGTADVEDPAERLVANPGEQTLAANLAYTLGASMVGPTLTATLRKLAVTGRVARPDAVFDVGLANFVRAVSGEYIFPWRDAAAMVDAYLALIADNSAVARHCHPGWVSLRCINGTTSALSMFSSGVGEKFCSIELPLLLGLEDTWVASTAETLRRYQALCEAHGGRFHWAQAWVKDQAGLRDYLLQHYPRFNAWRRGQREVGGSRFDHGTLPASV